MFTFVRYDNGRSLVSLLLLWRNFSGSVPLSMPGILLPLTWTYLLRVSWHFIVRLLVLFLSVATGYTFCILCMYRWSPHIKHLLSTHCKILHSTWGFCLQRFTTWFHGYEPKKWLLNPGELLRGKTGAALRHRRSLAAALLSWNTIVCPLRFNKNYDVRYIPNVLQCCSCLAKQTHTQRHCVGEIFYVCVLTFLRQRMCIKSQSLWVSHIAPLLIVVLISKAKDKGDSAQQTNMTTMWRTGSV